MNLKTIYKILEKSDVQLHIIWDEITNISSKEFQPDIEQIDGTLTIAKNEVEQLMRKIKAKGAK